MATTILHRILHIESHKPAPRWPEPNEIHTVLRYILDTSDPNPRNWRNRIARQNVTIMEVRENPYVRLLPGEPDETIFVCANGWCYDCVFTQDGRLIAYDLWLNLWEGLS